jgi:hypothetical protein
MMRSFLARQPADAVFGPPVDLSPWQGVRVTQEVLAEVAEHLRTVVASLGRDAPALPATE